MAGRPIAAASINEMDKPSVTEQLMTTWLAAIKGLGSDRNP